RTRIGSPHVIAGMQAARTAGAKAVAGYEANGGFLTGFTASRDGRSLPPLMTRDSVLPLIAPLGLARERGLTLAALNATLPARFTATDRLVGVETDASARLIRSIDDDGPARTELFEGLGTVAAVDRTDGFRATLADGRIAHLRPSGNAPECRVYAEAESPEAAHALQSEVMSRVARMLDGGAR
ncbi:MAG: phosphomannomutase, partial [Alphaproteobacteria bacterium]|nr:phosphomannomutase [Alphaproteobacteria bacterium]